MTTIDTYFRRVLALLGSAVALTLAGCASGQQVVVTQTLTPGVAPSSAADVVTVPPAGVTRLDPSSEVVPTPTVRIMASPEFGSTDLAPTAPVGVTVLNASIKGMSFTSLTGGGVLAGEVSADGQSWALTDRMEFSTTYSLVGTAVARNGTETPINGTFTTVDAGETMRASFQLVEGGTYGVGTPIILTFAGQVTDKAAVEESLSVMTDKGEIEGSWGWLQDEDIQGSGTLQSRVHYRTAEYWPGYTAVTVKADLYGVALGNGLWGREDLELQFTIGRSQIVTADVTSFRLVVEVDGVVAKDYPVSYGRNTDDPELETRSGVHLVQEKFDKFEMCNPKYGYCGFEAFWAVRISNNGEFIHENAAVVASLGRENVSHGCVNMGPADAKDYYDSVLYGDPVEVSGTSTQLGPADGDIFDWTYPYSEWQSFSAL